MDDRDFNILADLMFYPASMVARRHAVSEGTVARTKDKYKHAYENMLHAKRNILVGFAEAGLYDGLAKVLKMINNIDAYAVRETKDITAMTRAMLDLSKMMIDIDTIKGNGLPKNKTLKTLSKQAEEKLGELIEVDAI